MERKKIVVLTVLLTALLLALGSNISRAVEENTWEYEGYFEDYIWVEVTTPAQAYPGDKITIEVAVEAQEDLEDVVVDVRVLGTKKSGTESWESSWKSGVIDVDELEEGDDESDDCDITIPTDVDPGVICGYIYCEFYSVTDDETYYFETGFPMTYLLSKAYEDLQEDYADLQANYTDLSGKYSSLQTTYNSLKATYDSLKATYDSLKTTYDSLKATYDSLKATYDSLKATYDSLKTTYDALKPKYDSLDSEHKSLVTKYSGLESEYKATAGELSNYKTYTYIFVATTVVFVVTTIIIAVRKPKTV